MDERAVSSSWPRRFRPLKEPPTCCFRASNTRPNGRLAALPAAAARSAGPESTEELLADLAGEILARWLPELVHRTGGNPFFIEEVVRLSRPDTWSGTVAHTGSPGPSEHAKRRLCDSRRAHRPSETAKRAAGPGDRQGSPRSS
jgi:hypothetical protein